MFRMPKRWRAAAIMAVPALALAGMALATPAASAAPSPVTFTFLHVGTHSSVAYSNGSVKLATGFKAADNAQVQLNNVAGSVSGLTEPAIAVTGLPLPAGHEVVLYLVTNNGNHTVFGYPQAESPGCATPDTAGWCWSVNGNTYGATWTQVLDHITVGGGLKSATLSLDQWVASGASATVTSLSWAGQNLLPATVRIPAGCAAYQRVKTCNAAAAALTANGVNAGVSVNWHPPLSQRIAGKVYNIKPGLPDSQPAGTVVNAGSSFNEFDGIKVH